MLVILPSKSIKSLHQVIDLNDNLNFLENLKNFPHNVPFNYWDYCQA